MKNLIIKTISYVVRFYSATMIMLNVLSIFIPLVKGKEAFVRLQLIPCIVVFAIFTAIHIKYKKKG